MHLLSMLPIRPQSLSEIYPVFFEQKSLEHLLDSAFHLLTCPLKARQSQDNTEADNFYQIVAASITVFYFFLIKLTNGTKREGRKEIFNLQREVIFIL